jgi:nitrite reductase (NADH) large subunit
MDTRTGTYRKLIVRGDRLIGAVLLGDTTLGPRLADALRRGTPLPPALLSSNDLLSDASDDCEGDDMLVCSCLSVTRGRILEVARSHDLAELETITRVTGAGGGCGTCRPNVASVLRSVRAGPSYRSKTVGDHGAGYHAP